MTAREIIQQHKGKITYPYFLVNNFGYIVSYKRTKYDVRRWRNAYGSDCGWEVMHLNHLGGTADDAWVEELTKDLNNHKLNTDW